MGKGRSRKEKRQRNPKAEMDEMIDEALERIQRDDKSSQATKEFLESLKRHGTGAFRALEKLLRGY